MPLRDFRFLSDVELQYFDIEQVSGDGDKGFMLECELRYPIELHGEHDLPLAPEKRYIEDEMLSPFAKQLWENLRGKVK